MNILGFVSIPRPNLNGCGIADEHLFNRMLRAERNRTARTGDPFVLMLMELNGLHRELPPKRVTELCSTIRSVTRESDFAGWYSHPTIIGMLFTALRDATPEIKIKALAEKTESALSQVLRPAERKRMFVSYHFFPEKSDPGAPKISSDEKFYPDLDERNGGRSLRTMLKRSIDVTGALVGLILSAPVCLVIHLMIKATSPGPVLFRQRRIGKFGREFDFLKFRTMAEKNDPSIHQQYVQKLIRQQAPAGDSGVYKIANDPRVTHFGRFLRKSSLDELPQLLNVLKGDMSLVGPRPPIPYEVSCYKHWHRRRVIEVKPGITGLWQVYGRSRTTFDEMVRLDLRYIREQSIWLDLKIIAKTPAAVITGAGAY